MLVTGADAIGQAYLAEKIRDYAPEEGPCIIAVKGGDIAGAVSYRDYDGVNMLMTCAGDNGWLTAGNVAGFFFYPFEQLGCRRVTSFVHRNNKKSRKLLEGLGYQLEGVHRKAAPSGGDLMSYGLLKSECKWLKAGHKTKWVSYGQILPSHASAA